MKVLNEKDLELLSGDIVCEGDPAPESSWLIVSDEDTYAVAQSMKEFVSGRIKEIEAYFKSRKQRASAVHKDICAMEKDALSPYLTEKGSLQGKQNAYLARIEKVRIEAELKIKAQSEEPVFIPAAPKQKGTRTTYSGEVTDVNAFLEYLIKTNQAMVYIKEFKASALNTLAEQTLKSESEVPGFTGKKNVSAI